MTAERHSGAIVTDAQVDGGDLVARLAAECADMAAIMAAIQQQFSDILSSSGTGLDASSIRLFQDMDRITQTLEDLSRLQAGLAGELAGRRVPTRKIARFIKLQSLIDRLSHGRV